VGALLGTEDAGLGDAELAMGAAVDRPLCDAAARADPGAARELLAAGVTRPIASASLSPGCESSGFVTMGGMAGGTRMAGSPEAALDPGGDSHRMSHTTNPTRIAVETSATRTPIQPPRP
jgi:hypothetical protein